jgi:hypothetical protein
MILRIGDTCLQVHTLLTSERQAKMALEADTPINPQTNKPKENFTAVGTPSLNVTGYILVTF